MLLELLSSGARPRAYIVHLLLVRVGRGIIVRLSIFAITEGVAISAIVIFHGHSFKLAFLCLDLKT